MWMCCASTCICRSLATTEGAVVEDHPPSGNPSSGGTLTIPDSAVLASREKPIRDDFGHEPTSAEVVALAGNVLSPGNSDAMPISADIRDTTMTTSTDADLVESNEIIEKFIRETAFLDNERRFRETKVWIWTSMIAAHALGGILGSMAASSLADKYGRKATVFLNNIWATIGAVLMMICYSTKIWYFILLARLVFGFNAGITSVLVPVYLTELSPDNLRGTIGTCHQLFISFAILVADDDETDAEAALNTLRGTPDVQYGVKAIKSEILNSQYRFDVIVVIGLTVDGGFWAVCGLLFLSVFIAALPAWLVDSSCFGRPPLLLIGIFGMFFSSVAVVLALVLIENRISIKEYRTTGIFFEIIFLISYAIGPGSIPWFYITELYTTSARANGMSFACAVGWTVNFILALIFPIAKERFSSYSFLIFVLPLFASGIISLIHIPEMKVKSIREIQTELEENRPSCL